MSLVSSKPKLANGRQVAGLDRFFNGLFGGIFFGFLVCVVWGALEIESAKRTLLDAGVAPSWFNPKTDLFGEGERHIGGAIGNGIIIAGAPAGLLLAWLRIRRMRPNAFIVLAGLALTGYVAVWAAQSYLRLREVVPREVQSALQEVRDWEDKQRKRKEREAAEDEKRRDGEPGV